MPRCCGPGNSGKIAMKCDYPKDRNPEFADVRHGSPIITAKMFATFCTIVSEETCPPAPPHPAPLQPPWALSSVEIPSISVGFLLFLRQAPIFPWRVPETEINGKYSFPGFLTCLGARDIDEHNVRVWCAARRSFDALDPACLEPKIVFLVERRICDANGLSPDVGEGNPLQLTQ